MEIFFGLTAIVLAAIALWRAKIVGENNEQLTDRLTQLELEVYRLRQKQTFPAPVTPNAPPAPAGEIPTAARTGIPVPESEIPVVIPPPPVIQPPPIIPSEPKSVPAFALPPVFAAQTRVEPETELPSIAKPPPIAQKNSFEMRLGTFWLVRIGIVMLLTGLAFFANYAYHHIVGQTRPGRKNFPALSCQRTAARRGRLVAAAQRQRVVEKLCAGSLRWRTRGGLFHDLRRASHSAVARHRKRAGSMARCCSRGRASSRGSPTAANPRSWRCSPSVWRFTARSSRASANSRFTPILILTVAAVVFLVRNRWAGLSFASLATSYAGYAFWRFLHDDGWRWAAPGENLWLGAGFLASYWLVFTAATFLSKSEKLSGPNRAAFLTLNNGAFFALVFADDAASSHRRLLEIFPRLRRGAARARNLRQENSAGRTARKKFLSHARPAARHAWLHFQIRRAATRARPWRGKRRAVRPRLATPERRPEIFLVRRRRARHRLVRGEPETI